MAYLEAKILIYQAQKGMIILLLVVKVTIPVKYLDYVNLFWKELIMELLKENDIIKHLIGPKSKKQLPI